MQAEFVDAAGSQSADYGARRATPQNVVLIRHRRGDDGGGGSADRSAGLFGT
jgi:hypothetical protein